MKILLTSFLIAIGMHAGTSLLNGTDQEELEMMVLAEEALKDKVKIYDYQGSLITEFKAEDVANNDITVSNYLILNSSDYAFTYLGDYYYLRD